MIGQLWELWCQGRYRQSMRMNGRVDFEKGWVVEGGWVGWVQEL